MVGRIGVKEEGGGAGALDDVADGSERLEQVGGGEDLIIQAGRAVPDDLLVVVHESGDAERRRQCCLSVRAGTLTDTWFYRDVRFAVTTDNALTCELVEWSSGAGGALI